MLLVGLLYYVVILFKLSISCHVYCNKISSFLVLPAGRNCVLLEYFQQVVLIIQHTMQGYVCMLQSGMDDPVPSTLSFSEGLAIPLVLA